MIEQLDLFEVSNDDVYDIDLSTRQWKTYNLIKMNNKVMLHSEEFDDTVFEELEMRNNENK